ncbi:MULTISPECIES: transcriptional repressor LexA [Leptospira]|uniref:LexA repressor n=7 Tax=Leptospira santarosai TaxID=28183 RepID=A0AB73LPZ0_9LEPT|nr:MULTISPECIES: transcriptional repressor LexA [Leptospira]EMO59381.1 repressor LexA [Leptospira santarosai str. CBC1416]AVV49837.1 LexA repressor [Leptospira santarosai]AVV79413.1 LexA repressor [Leptospira santarosai]EKO35796.1 repressor LexA [Leptospira santarosai str. MOR084]EKO80188.1 repressor LexA [Leptospira sp. Fiocruz LV3954]
MKDLTDKQQAVLTFITTIIKERGFPPTIREIGDEFGITAKGAYDHLKAIEKKGYLKTAKNQSRAIELIRQSPMESIPVQATSIPVIGRVAAGLPIFAEENIESYIPIPDGMVKGNVPMYALRVQGNSMVEAGIKNEDIAIIEKRNIARDGDIVVALIEDEATLKVYYKEQDQIRLEARNPEYKPINTKEAVVIGKLVGLYRIY